MATCIHCATPFSASDQLEKFCCRGCEYVYDLIHEEGLDRFYELRSSSTIRPVRSTPFEAQDLAWLAEHIAKTEENHPVGQPVEADFSLEGLSCVGCVWLVESIFLRHPGALEASAHPSTGLLRLRWSAGEMDLAAFAREIASFGYTLTLRKAGMSRSEARELGARLGLCAAFAMNAMVFTLPTYVGMPEDFAFAGIFKLVTFLSATLSMLVGGSYFIKRAWHAVLSRTPHIDLPIALGILLAFGGSLIGWAFDLDGLMYFDFVATFIFLMLGGRYLQLAAVEKNRNRLQRRRPLPEHFSSPDRAEPISISELNLGIRFKLQPGQSVPVAATLDSSAADFSLEWINGEAESQTFHAGRTLPAGAIYLGKDSITLTAGETWENSLLARLTGSDRTAARIPALEKILRIYLLVIILVGCAGFGVWLATGTAAEALQVMISVFVVSCPCALGVALPLADELASSRMERAGVFIREAQIWPRLCTIRSIIFDKTGTLTLERPVLKNPEALTALDDSGRLALARLTFGSLHPVSRSLLEALGKKGQELLRSAPGATVEDVPGLGRFFENDTGKWSLGRPGWAAGKPQTLSPHDAELSHNGEPIALFNFSEMLRPDSTQALRNLKASGHRLIILSGDNKEKVAAVADSLGISRDDAHASLFPEQKEEIVRRLDRQDTLYLGDGANDSLAFNAAYVTGTPVVDRSLLESKSDFFFLGQSLQFLPAMLSLARRRKQTVRIAFSFALIYNAAAITTALLGHMNPLLAAIIMPLSSAISLAIVARGLRGKG
ncbi:heavy metal translocating P-type ATPase [Luteolibacter algae]|uniref:Heavy metal translocating P-type ATPase n=1 Tax=Luteolibacter algae TaxID=454151 RepID=A0ABW5D2S2_9BACT